MLTQDQRAFYHEHGYVVIRGLLPRAEADALRRECHTLADRLSAHGTIDATWGSARGAVAQGQPTTIVHCHNVEFYAAAFGRLIVDERLTGVAAALMDGPNVQLHHTKMFIKPPEKGSPFPMHQDYPFFPHRRHSMLAAIIHFDDAPVEKGCVRVVPGSHKRGPLSHVESGGWHLPFEEYPLEAAVPCPAAAGDALFFSYLTVHGSGINMNDEARTTLLVQMRDPANAPTEGGHEEPGQGLMLRGINPSVGTPVVG